VCQAQCGALLCLIVNCEVCACVILRGVACVVSHNSTAAQARTLLRNPRLLSKNLEP